jgi:hypothetical protein
MPPKAFGRRTYRSLRQRQQSVGYRGGAAPEEPPVFLEVLKGLRLGPNR